MVASSADCRRAKPCEREGACSVRETVVDTLGHAVKSWIDPSTRMDLSCGAMKDKDCKHAWACVEEDRCNAEGGVCVKLAEDASPTRR